MATWITASIGTTQMPLVGHEVLSKDMRSAAVTFEEGTPTSGRWRRHMKCIEKAFDCPDFFRLKTGLHLNSSCNLQSVQWNRMQQVFLANVNSCSGAQPRFQSWGVQFLGLGYYTKQNTDGIPSFVHCSLQLRKKLGRTVQILGSRPPNPPQWLCPCSCSCSLHVIAHPSVCRLSVMLVHPTHAVVIFRNISMALGTLAIRWHPLKISRRSSQGNPSTGGELNTRGVAKYSDFGPIDGYIVETVQDRR